jgi:exopolysaccharide biosynthesis polyprenyl glycosylphosphotransferase
MFRRFSINFALFSIALDALVIGISLSLAVQTRPLMSIFPFAAHYPSVISLHWIIYPIFTIEWISILMLFSVYDGRRNFRWINAFSSLTLGTLLAAMAMAGTLYLSFRQVSRLLFISFVLLGYLAMITWRGLSRILEKLKSHEIHKQRRVLIIGSGPAGRELQSQIQANPQFNLSVIGFLDDAPQGSTSDVLGNLDDLHLIIRDREPQEVVIALPQHNYQIINGIIAELHHLPLKVWVIPDYFRLALHKAAVEEFAGIPMLDLRAPALSEEQRMFKRAFDLGITFLTLPFVLPVTGLIALAVWLEGSGPIFFIQQRVGENGRLFRMYKFRTMQVDAEHMRHTIECQDEQGQLVHKHARDPRVTRMGRILRRTSLDELPQLLNVIKGDMSLVGPRPELPYLVDCYETWQRRRFAVPQGITGWWQINGRSDRLMHLHTEDDLYYIQHYSPFLDIFILLKTLIVVIHGKGAF